MDLSKTTQEIFNVNRVSNKDQAREYIQQAAMVGEIYFKRGNGLASFSLQKWGLKHFAKELNPQV